MEKIWQIAPLVSKKFQDKFPEISPVILQLLFNRGMDTQEKIDEFLQPDYSQDIHDPFLLQDMKLAVQRIYKGIKKREKIVICGDYDTDGVTSTTLLFRLLKKLGATNLHFYIPDREIDGYGLNIGAIQKFKEENFNLIITCDCGISNKEEITLANSFGLDVIVTDHHREPRHLPPALAIINPQLKREKYPFKFLAGVGVAFKLGQALLRSKECSLENKEATEKWLLDLVALGTVADSMPLLGENRVLVKYGLVVLNKTKNLGLKSLIRVSSLNSEGLRSEDISFRLSPRINAAGRINQATDALNLFLSSTFAKAEEWAENLNILNTQRQKITEKIFKSVQVKPREKIIIALGEDWPGGILGLVANKLVDAFYRPALVLSRKEGEISGSGRSIDNFDLFTFLRHDEKYFKNFGGHSGAVGFTLKDEKSWEAFKKSVKERSKKALLAKDLKPFLKIEAQLEPADINWDFYEQFIGFQPFGFGNPCPNFLLLGVTLEKIQAVGRGDKHYRLFIEGGKKMIYFNSAQKMINFRPGEKIDVVFRLEINQWNGTQELQLNVLDIKKTLKNKK
jgi:single-stranded-DNA-specific exonuclease